MHVTFSGRSTRAVRWRPWDLATMTEPTDAPRLSGVHDWKIGKLKSQKRRHQQSTGMQLATTGLEMEL